MPVDLERLEAMASFTDPVMGISERFVDVPLRSGSTIGVLSLPVGARAATGWLMSHSFGPEQGNLTALDVAIARRLASRGSPVLRFQCQGYGDSEHATFVPTIDSHVQDTVDAAEALRELAGVRSIGLVGTRFGASCALLAAPEVAADHVALIAPAVRGVHFLRELVRSRAVIELSGSAGPGDTPDAWSALKDGGSISVRGSLITGDHYRAFDALDLRTTRGFTGSALVMQVSTGTEPRRGVSELSDRLESQGVTVTRAVVTDPSAAFLGERHFRPAERDLLGNIAADLHEKISTAVVDWCADAPAATEPEGSARR